MTIGSQSPPEYWPAVHQLMHSGWYRAGAPLGPDSTEWGLRIAQAVDAETALRCWIAAVDEGGAAQRLGVDGVGEQSGTALEAAESD